MEGALVQSAMAEIAMWDAFAAGRTANATGFLAIVLAVWVAARFSSVSLEKNVNMFSVFTLSSQTFTPCKSKTYSFTRYTTTRPSQNTVKYSLLEDNFRINGLMRISMPNNDKIPGVNVSYK